MKEADRKWTRRDFFKSIAAAGMGTLALPAGTMAAVKHASAATVARRPFGKSGIHVPMLSLGGIFDTGSNHLLLKQALRWGVSYWDTANSYVGGDSEIGIGKFFQRFPGERKKVFLVTKSGAWTLRGMTRHLDRSLERMQTDYIDLMFVHGISSIRTMDRDTRQWAEKAKSQGKIRLFGFSTHRNMAECLLGAAGLGWIDGIMMTYNYRLMHEDEMRRAVDACTEAGIGLTAMKVQGGGQVKTNTAQELQLAGRFLKKGFTSGQAKLKAVWQNPQIASICSQMPTLDLLMTNVQAAMDKTTLSAADQQLMQEHAALTRADYCAGCGSICEACVEGQIPIADVMRSLMYRRSYGDHDLAVETFTAIPEAIRVKMAETDYRIAEKACPRNMSIGEMMHSALKELSA